MGIHLIIDIGATEATVGGSALREGNNIVLPDTKEPILYIGIKGCANRGKEGTAPILSGISPKLGELAGTIAPRLNNYAKNFVNLLFIKREDGVYLSEMPDDIAKLPIGGFAYNTNLIGPIDDITLLGDSRAGAEDFMIANQLFDKSNLPLVPIDIITTEMVAGTSVPVLSTTNAGRVRNSQHLKNVRSWQGIFGTYSKSEIKQNSSDSKIKNPKDFFIYLYHKIGGYISNKQTYPKLPSSTKQQIHLLPITQHEGGEQIAKDLAKLLVLKKFGVAETHDDYIKYEEAVIKKLMEHSYPEKSDILHSVIDTPREVKKNPEQFYSPYRFEAQRRKNHHFNYAGLYGQTRQDRKRLLDFCDYLQPFLNKLRVDYKLNKQDYGDYSLAKFYQDRLLPLRGVIEKAKKSPLQEQLLKDIDNFCDEFQFLCSEKLTENYMDVILTENVFSRFTSSTKSNLKEEKIDDNRQCRENLIEFVRRLQKIFSNFGDLSNFAGIQDFKFFDDNNKNNLLAFNYQQLKTIHKKCVEWLNIDDKKNSLQFARIAKLRNSIAHFLKNQNNRESLKIEEEIIDEISEKTKNKNESIDYKSLPYYDPLHLEAIRRKNKEGLHYANEDDKNKEEKPINNSLENTNSTHNQQVNEKKAVINFGEQLLYAWIQGEKRTSSKKQPDTEKLIEKINNLGKDIKSVTAYYEQLFELYKVAQQWLATRYKNNQHSSRLQLVAHLTRHIADFLGDKKNATNKSYQTLMQEARADLYFKPNLAKLWKEKSNAVCFFSQSKRTDKLDKAFQEYDKAWKEYNKNPNLEKNKNNLEQKEEALKKELNLWNENSEGIASKRKVLVNNFAKFFSEKNPNYIIANGKARDPNYDQLKQKHNSKNNKEGFILDDYEVSNHNLFN